MKKFCLLLALLLLFSTLSFVSCAAAEKENVYEIVGEYDEEKGELNATMTFTYYNDTQKPIEVLWFALYPNAYREGALYSPISVLHQTAYYDGASYGGIAIGGVDGVRTWEIGGEDKDLLFVTLSSPLKPHAKTELKISFTTTLAKVEHRLGITKNTVNLTGFYPILCGRDEDGFYECIYYNDGDPFYSDCASYRVELILPQGYVVASSGKQLETIENNGGKIVLTGEKMRDFALVLSKDFSVEKKTVGETEILYYYYNDEAPKETLAVAERALGFFADNVGEYAYPTYSVVQSGFCFSGMEYPALSLLSDSLDRKAAEYTVVHETAHQWWYAMVGNNPCEHAWMDEGLAEYCTAAYFKEVKGKEEKDALLSAAREGYRSYCGIYGKFFGEVNEKMDRPLSSFLGEYEYVNIAYHKGCILFDSVANGIGEKKFFACLKKYYERYRFQNATPEGMIECFNSLGTDVKGIFRSFLEGEAAI